jgi:hypothetical protein
VFVRPVSRTLRCSTATTKGNKEMATKFTIKLNTKPTWKISRGHSDYRGGAGKHDNRPRKLRTKSAQKNQAIRDFY